MTNHGASPTCPLCGGTKSRPARTFPHSTIVRCACGMFFTATNEAAPVSPSTPEEYTEEYYTEEYDMLDEAWKAPFFTRRIPLFEKYRDSGEILDVGCGVGSFFKHLDRDRWKYEGVELSSWAADYCHDHYDTTVYQGELPELHISKSYDVITLWEVLEHITNPLEYLQKINSLLKNQGFLVLSVPNIRSLLYFAKDPHFLCPRYHYLHFSPKTLRMILDKTGFDEIYLKTFPAMGLAVLKPYRPPGKAQGIEPPIVNPAETGSGGIKGFIKNSIYFWADLFNAHESMFCIARKRGQI